jgi:hypothetical protein
VIIGCIDIVFVLSSQRALVLDRQEPALSLAVVATHVARADTKIAWQLRGRLGSGRRDGADGEAGAAGQLSGAAAVGALLALARALTPDLECDEGAHDAHGAASHGGDELVDGWPDDDAFQRVQDLRRGGIRDDHPRWRTAGSCASPERPPLAMGRCAGWWTPVSCTTRHRCWCLECTLHCGRSGTEQSLKPNPGATPSAQAQNVECT